MKLNYILSYHFCEDDYQDGVISPEIEHVISEIDSINERVRRGERLGGINLYVERINDQN